MMKFPKKFLWGAATSAHQVEGNNIHSDWWHWEKKGARERSGRACRHYELYEDDFDLAKGLHQNAHRFSVEWARIEPREGRFSRKALDHYVDVVRALKARGMEPIVTLHHFTNPLWFSKMGGWTHRKAPDLFLRYCDRVIRALGRQVRFWITINEPLVYVSHAYVFGVWPPQAKSYLKAALVEDNLVTAHAAAYRLIHRIYREMKLFQPSVGLAQNVMAFVPCKRDFKNRLAAFLRDKFYNLTFLDQVMQRRAMDFIGVNYYSRQLVDLRRFGIRNLVMDDCKSNHHRTKKNSLGWDIYPKGLYQVLMGLKRYGLPVIVTENGICTTDDRLKWDYLYAHLKNIHRAIRNGVYVMGYLCWALLDNFEWDKGFGPRFGLIEVDYKTFRRRVRKSALKFARVCRTGVLTP